VHEKESSPSGGGVITTAFLKNITTAFVKIFS
jgi:hypothetical protein